MPYRTTLLALLAAGALVSCFSSNQPGGNAAGEGGTTGSDGSFTEGGSLAPGSEGGTTDGSSGPTGEGSTPIDGSTEASAASLDTPAVEAKVAQLLGAMTLAQKAGQMVMVEYTAVSAPLGSPSDVATYGLGALLAGGGDAPGTDQPSDWLNLTNQYRAPAMTLPIPIIFGIDAVHGTAKVAGATVFPHGIGMGCTRDPGLVQQAEHATASELVAMGINMSFSPDSDVGQDERWGRTYESFGEDPTLVSTMVAAAVTGYQQPNLGAPGTVLACPKHVLGAGGTTWGTGVDGGIDQGDTELTEAQMRAVHFPPFQAAISAGAMSMMVSYSSWCPTAGACTKMSASTEWLTTVIKGELAYKGFLLSDFNAIQQLPGTAQEQEATAINAGLDMIMMSGGHAAFISDIVSLVGAGTIAKSRIDDAVTRILRAKVIAGLFGASAAPSGALSNVGAAANRQIAKQAVQESAVLLQNNNNVLPLSKSAQILVAGAATDLGVQSGGWTLGWQGVTNLTTPLSSSQITGTPLATALQNAATSSSLVTWDYDPKSFPAGTQVGVVVLYENPYAEFLGDTDSPSFSNTGTGQNPSGNTIYDNALPGIVSDVQAANATAKIPLVLVLMSGRPILIQSYLSTFDAIVAAWLPGSEGEGLADLLYGDAQFTGKLSKSWPMDNTTLPISSLQTGADPLYAFGFGLTH